MLKSLSQKVFQILKEQTDYINIDNIDDECTCIDCMSTVIGKDRRQPVVN